jgi:intracellular multiplication protein IcmT
MREPVTAARLRRLLDWTTFIAATGVIIFMMISWAGLTVPSALRMIKRAPSALRPAVPAWKRPRFA